MTTGYTDHSGYSFKSGVASLVNHTSGLTLTNNQTWFGDANSTGTAGTSLKASASSPVLADANFSTKTVNFGSYRIGDTKSQAITLTNLALFSSDGTTNLDGSPKLTTQALKINSASATGGSVSYGTYTSQTYVSGAAVTSTSAGSFAPATNILNAPLTAVAPHNATTVNIAIDTATVGNKSGNILFTLQSVQGNSIATSTTNLTNETVSFTGTGYRAAEAGLSTTTASLGNFRVGDSGSSNITISNTATSGDAFSEKLSVYDKSVTGNATAGTLPSGLITAGSNSTDIAKSHCRSGVRSGARDSSVPVCIMVAYSATTEYHHTGGATVSAVGHNRPGRGPVVVQ
jgi:hypothetical protein